MNYHNKQPMYLNVHQILYISQVVVCFSLIDIQLDAHLPFQYNWELCTPMAKFDPPAHFGS